jgi:hydroxyacylglutathione hydrolase
MLKACENQDPADALVTSIAQERDINTFFRLQSPTVVAKLAEEFPELGDNPDARAVFLKLRELRNSW